MSYCKVTSSSTGPDLIDDSPVMEVIRERVGARRVYTRHTHSTQLLKQTCILVDNSRIYAAIPPLKLHTATLRGPLSGQRAAKSRQLLRPLAGMG